MPFNVIEGGLANKKIKSPLFKAYLLRAVHAYLSDFSLTPLLTITMKGCIYDKLIVGHNKELVLNINYCAVRDLVIGNERITFKASFSGKTTQLSIPMLNVIALYSEESGEGIEFVKVAGSEQILFHIDGEIINEWSFRNC